MVFMTAYAALMLIFIYLFRGLNPAFFMFAAAAVSALILLRNRPPHTSRRRIAAYDYLRLAALILVIATHTISANMTDIPPASTAGRMGTAGWMLTIICNPLYVMLCGALLYERKETSLLSFYADKLQRVMLPMFLYFLWYLWAHEQFIGQPQAIPVSEALRSFFSMSPPQAPHFWLIWRILFLYLTAPVVGRIVRKLSYRQLTGLLFLLLAVCTAVTYLPLLTNTPISRSEWPEWLVAALAGWWMSRPETRKADGLILTAAIAGACIIAYAAYMNPYNALITVYLCNTAPLAVLFAMGFFAFFLHPFLKISARNLPEFLTRYNYDCVLIHWGALYFIVRKLPVATASGIPAALLTLLEIPVTLAISLAASFGIRNFYVYPVTTLVSFLRRKITGS